MSYSKKIDNVVDDLKLNLPILNFNKLDKDFYFDLERFVSVDENKLSNIIKDAELQEDTIRKYIK